VALRSELSAGRVVDDVALLRVLRCAGESVFGGVGVDEGGAEFGNGVVAPPHRADLRPRHR